jgi:hypothetical protein
MTIKAGGNVGIGTASPSYKLSVVGPNGGNAISWTDNINNTGYLGIRGGGVASIGADNNLVFETGGTPQMRRTSGGNVLIGTTTDAGFKLDVNGTGRYTPTSSSSVPTLMLSQGSGAGAYANIAGAGDMFHGLIMRGIPAAAGDYSVTAGDQMSFYEYGGIFNFYKKQPGVLLRQAYIDNGSFYGASFFETSDATIKTLIEDDYQVKGIDSVVAKLYIKNGKEELGYFAQDLESILPSAVNKGTDGLLNLSYREVHTAKLQFLEQKIKELEAKLS